MSERILTSCSRTGVMEITLNRPDKRNAIDKTMVDAILGAFQTAELDAAVQVVAIRGAGKDFCAGADLAELLASADKSPKENAADAEHLGNVFLAIHDLPKPVVALVTGRALAGGCGLATACDLIVAEQSASFGYPEIKRGFVPAMVMAMLTRMVGQKVAFDLVATGRNLSADEAKTLGIVSRVFPDGEFESSATIFLDDLAGASSSALAFIKKQLQEIEGLSFGDAISLGAEVNAIARTSPDFRDAVAQFLKH